MQKQFLSFCFQVVWLRLKRDPTAENAGATLDRKVFEFVIFVYQLFFREVSSLEPFLEALPSLCVMLYLVPVEPSLFHSQWRQTNLIRAYGTLCFSMALFLKSGPCFFLQSKGPFSGICTWKFAVVFAVNAEALYCKIAWPKEPSTKMLNLFCVAGSTSLLSIFLIFKALGSWKRVFKAIATYPGLILLPTVGYFSFGKIQEKVSEPTLGLALSWKWTFVNMLMSLGVTTALHMHDMDQMNLGFFNMSIKESVDCGGVWRGLGWTEASYIREWTKDVLVSSFLTILLFWRQEPVFGVLLPELSEEPGGTWNMEPHHLTREGEIEPLVISSPVKYSRQAQAPCGKKIFFLQIGTEEKISEASLGHPRPHHVDHRGARHGKICQQSKILGPEYFS